MKKFTCLGLSMVLAFGLLAGCGSSNSGSSDSGTQSNAPAQQETTELSGTITANGSTSMEKVIQILEEQFMIDNPGVKASYDPTGSGTGIEAAKNGTADIGLASRALKDEETAAGLKGTNVALDGIAVIVNADSKVEDLTVEQIAQVFTGEIADWSELGGDAGAIACIGREGGSGTRDGFELHRRGHRGGEEQPPGHRLCLSVRRGGQGGHQGHHCGRRALHGGDRSGRLLPDPAPLCDGDPRERGPQPRRPGLL